MSDDYNQKYAFYQKMAWILYTVVAVLVIVFLVFVKAQDNEERLFFSLMGSAVFYVFRPTEKFFRKKIEKIIGTDEEKADD